ncbi:uncharacterized protein FIBRA_00612 [Fibroporia radiculosa]|uniref:Serine/threonine-protein kinase TEL1 n=1 Tax=Fibroporia radiculosa TaxID=599839 RepID=J4GI63_9APHY|nr:uncharacterized protein FIBRA_00612 [Fibroporia radiculosa]CCL98610.1 predicted protein [Fibroporia radiculosa]
MPPRRGTASSGTSLKNVLEHLKSEKVKERQEGLAALRTTFASDSAVLNLDATGDGRAWLAVFQALFTAVGTERAAYIKKGESVVVMRRLGDAASAVRWLVERSVARMNNKVLKSLYLHLLQTMIHKGRLFAPLALDYIKALRCILGWTPHMEHLREELWVRILELGLNVVLGDPIRRRLDEDVDDPNDETEASVATGTDVEMFMDEADEDLGTPSTSTTISQRKRKHRSPDPKGWRGGIFTGSPAPRSQPVTLEQIECMSILALLLRSSSAPLLSSNHTYLCAALFDRLARFIRVYPGDSSLHHDYLLALSAALSHAALNARAGISRFAKDAWDGLLGMWGTKNQRMKQDLVVVLRTLFPYFVEDWAENEEFSHVDFGDGVIKLWQLLNSEAENRWGVNGLSLDSLRLQLVHTGDENEHWAFVAPTVRYGWDFDANQALAWVMLELQADCIEKLYHLVEFAHSTGSSSGRGKRPKLENPITSLLEAIRLKLTSHIRTYHLQVLLFVIHRHWAILHQGLRQEVVSVLLQFVSFEDGIVQSWVFLCLAAIAHADVTCPRNPSSNCVSPSLPFSTTTWDNVWAHSMRRTNVPAVSRAACHTAYVLLCHAETLLTSHRVLAEIETFAKDLDVQGPAFPCDSVCSFLVLSLRVASQDVRLYRMQLEEKALTWLIDSWRVQPVKRLRMPLHTPGDILMLLEGICSLSRRSGLIYAMQLPECSVVEALVEHHQTAVIRDFFLHSRLPPLRKGTPTNDSHLPQATAIDSGAGTLAGSSDTQDLMLPRGRERRISAFLMKNMEELISGGDSHKETSGSVTAEKVRSSLDISLLALSFEATLISNGIRSNRRTIQAACRLIEATVPLISAKRWTLEERTLILAGLEPLVLVDSRHGDVTTWETLVLPDESSGVRQRVLRDIRPAVDCSALQAAAMRRDIQRLIFQSVDVSVLPLLCNKQITKFQVQDVFAELTAALRRVLRIVVGDVDGDESLDAMEVDEKDDFGPVRTSQTLVSSIPTQQGVRGVSLSRLTVDICMTALTVIPILQSTSGEPTRDKDLADMVLSCPDDRFFFMAPAFFDNVREGTLALSASNMHKFLDRFGDLLQRYDFSKSERLQLMVVHFLNSTRNVWLQAAVASGPIGTQIRELWEWFCEMLDKKQVPSWRIRDLLVRFIDDYLAHDPEQNMFMKYDAHHDAVAILDDDDSEHWKERHDDDSDIKGLLPSALLPKLGADVDIRVRFRAAVANARLLRFARKLSQNPSTLYATIKKHLTVTLENYEHMLTRLLCLGNIIIVSSAVRRGPYWHLLETCLHTPLYTKHIESVLTGAAGRLGLPHLSGLFEAYASQLAFSIRQGGYDFLSFPAHLLGYQDKRQCAEASFRAFTPTNLIAHGTRDEKAHGEKLFVNHCRAVQLSKSEGIRACFSDIVGYQIVIWTEEHSDSEDSMQDLEDVLKAVTRDIGDQGDFEALLNQNADAIFAAILRTLGDQDVSPDGPIVYGLSVAGYQDDSIRTFHHLSRYRLANSFASHEPNLPCYCTQTVLESLKWLMTRVPNIDVAAITYHILHQLFADIECSSVLNEQMRLLNGITLWVAANHLHFRDYTLLRTIGNMAASLLAQPDLARASQSILEWCFGLYSAHAAKDTNVPDIFIRVSCLAHMYFQESQNLSLVAIGRDILQWIEEQASALCESNGVLKSQIVQALAAWPQELPPMLQMYRDAMNLHELSSVLGDHRISSNKFRLVRRLRDLTSNEHSSKHDDGAFMQSDFWRLKECIPPAAQLVDDDIDAFASLLIRNHGQVDSFGVVHERHSLQNARVMHRKLSMKKEPSDRSNAAYHAITFSLLTMLDATIIDRIHVAYCTLRTLMSTHALDNSRSWLHGYRGDLHYLQLYSRSSTPRPAVNLYEELASVRFLELSEHFSDWVPQFATLLCDSLSNHDPFYAALVPILRSDIHFAEQVLPVLVQAILAIERSEGSGVLQNSCPIREHLSQYLASILAHDLAHISCLRVLVDIVLHLRFFRPAGSKDALAHDSWLRVDYTLVSLNAIKCGAYTTALLLLELAAEYSDTTSPNANVTEEILFEIYSHIDEPDGFYGIQTHDLRRFLIRRLHHEQQWDKAFRFHGAALEACTSDTNNARGVVEALHSFGFDHLAMTSLGMLSENSEESTSPNAMVYHLGWRTQTWDLPEPLDGHSQGASLYLALRSVYKERNPHTIDQVVHKALTDELMHLRHLGDENLAEVHQVLQNIMCLSQVRFWRAEALHYVKSDLKAGDKKWDDFIRIDRDFEFRNTEAILATRIALVRSARQKEQREQIGNLLSPLCRDLLDLERKCLTCLSEAARHAVSSQIALNAISKAQSLEQSIPLDVSLEFANVLWLMKEPKLAVQSLSELSSDIQSRFSLDNSQDSIQTALLLARLGTWSAEASLRKPSEIMSQCFDPAILILAQHESQSPAVLLSEQAVIFHQYAIFAERQYHIIANSPDALRWRVYVDRKTEEIKQRQHQIQRTQPGTKEHVDLVRLLEKAKAVLRQDRAHFTDHTRSRDSFLARAVDMYSRCLLASDTFDNDSVIRLCSLWLSVFDKPDPALGFGVALDRVPSHKFVFLAHQLAARLSRTSPGQITVNQDLLQKLFGRMCREHPFHSLYQFKGEGGDDLRQDAVMEQVFHLVNVVLHLDRQTKRRTLSIRDYKVIPLASQAGVLEFVQNTSPLNHWLSGAHVRYRPTDISPGEVGKQLSKKHVECNHERGPLLTLFTEIRKKFKPVMRHWFMEKHKTPMSWFAMRLKYARSVATTSIGKLLPVPERVPFRLTADMVDGLGISGTQGVFQRCAEETLRVLRDQSELILTVLEVFKYDPLHSWTASELKVKRAQGSNETSVQLTGEAMRLAIGIDMASGTADEAADRALSAVNRKLDKTLSVEYVVNELVAEATDLGNLAQMYHGGDFVPH